MTDSDSPHFSLTLPTGCVTFLVQGKMFMVPEALLVRCSAAFPDFGGHRSYPSEPITLYDSAEAFETFVDYLYDSASSCLYSPEPELKPVLGILSIAHKYCAEEIERKALEIAHDLTQPSVLPSQLTNGLTPLDVFRVGMAVQSPEIANSAWELVLQSSRDGTLSDRSLLDVGTSYGKRQYWETAYYQVMLNHPEICWVHDPALTEKEHRRLLIAHIRCSTEWEAFQKRIGLSIFSLPSHPMDRLKTLPVSDSTSESASDTGSVADSGSILAEIPFWPVNSPRSDYPQVIQELIRVISQSAFPTWDIIGRLTWVIAFKPSYRGWPDIWNKVLECARNTLDTVESKLYRYFLLDDEDNDYPND